MSTTGSPRRSRSGLVAATLIVLAFLPMLFREVIIYKAGVVLIFFVAAIGLHVLVNWAGQLSLAHASMVGVPAFSVLAISEVHHISPLYLLPVAAVIGAAVGVVIGLPTLRAQGLQVALVTLVAGTAINRLFFAQTWLVGSAGGRAAATPTLGPFHFPTSRSLYPVLVVIVAATVTAAGALMHSKAARAWFWIQDNANAASAFGVPVVAYRLAAYGVGGAFGGLAGGLTVAWVQRLGQDAFPSTLSFSYILVAVLAGSGFAGGVAAATLALQGGQQFATNIFGTSVGKTVDTVLTYGGTLALIDMIARHQTGLNGLGRRVMHRLNGVAGGQGDVAETRPPAKAIVGSVLLAVGAICVAAGFLAIVVAWHYTSRTNQLWIQNQELLSGGVGGLGLIIVGVGLILTDRLTRIAAQLASEQRSVLPSLSAEAVTAGSPDPVPSASNSPSRRRTRAAGSAGALSTTAAASHRAK